MADKIVKDFMGRESLMNISKAVQPYQKPEPLKLNNKFTLIPEYFTNPSYALPKYLKRSEKEMDHEHLERTKQYMISCDKTTFSNVANLVDPTDERQQRFFILYKDVCKIRVEKESSGYMSKCSIF